MHLLKRLELNGFKSFAERTVLEFPEGITAIVGPNGSGKSNVVDAIRWLLGERDAKNLRGSKVEDLVFAGTPKRPRTGIARAGLHFENHAGFFAVDFPEVSVAREVTRDGQSKYFLNKSEVLLRDLVDFFARARLGSRGLTIVTQGKSDLFVEADPKTRREMIEEILGLREYELKKGEAERRLAQSRENLSKARALKEEILPHLRSLKRQTLRWEKRGELEAELRSIEDAYFGHARSALEEGKESLAARLKSHEEARAALKASVEAHEKRRAAVESARPKERDEAKAEKEKLEKVLARQSELQRELGKLEAQIEMAGRDSRGELMPPAAVLAAAVKKARADLASAHGADLESLRQAVGRAIADFDALFESKQERAGGVKDLEARLKEIHGQFKQLAEDRASREGRIKSLDEGQDAFYGEFRAAVEAFERAKDELEAWQRRGQDIMLERERLAMQEEDLKRRAGQAGRTLGEFAAAPAGGAPDAAAEKRMLRLRSELAVMGEADQAVLKEARETEARYDFLAREAEDLEKACADLERLSEELREKISDEFSSALKRINEEFGKFFHAMFDGGQAKLRTAPSIKRRAPDATDGEESSAGAGAAAEAPEEKESGGVEIEFRLPKKRANSLEALSGGERSLVGIAALFAMISVSPPPFLVLDEVDAALDERNARRFAELLREFSKRTQFVVITHNRATMEAADVLYGVTLGEDGTSKIVSLKLEKA